MNSVKTVLLLGLLSGILLVGGEALGGSRGLEYGLVLAIGMNFFSYFFSDKLALMSYSAQSVTPEESPEIYGRLAPIVQALDAEDGFADAQVVGDPGGFAECVCHGARSAACFGGGDGRDFAVDERSGTRRRVGA